MRRSARGVFWLKSVFKLRRKDARRGKAGFFIARSAFGHKT
jgi:hypothetical protein